MATLKTKNAFGGGNHNSAYVPMSELEQEVLARLVAAGDLVVSTSRGLPTIKQVKYGDLRLGIAFQLDFSEPALPMKLLFLDLELKTQAGRLLYAERQPTVTAGRAIEVCDGVYFDMIWDIALHHMDPKLVKDILPGAVGLTNRRTDKDTGNVTLVGNMRNLDLTQQVMLQTMALGETKMKQSDKRKLADLAKKAKGTANG